PRCRTPKERATAPFAVARSFCLRAVDSARRRRWGVPSGKPLLVTHVLHTAIIIRLSSRYADDRVTSVAPRRQSGSAPCPGGRRESHRDCAGAPCCLVGTDHAVAPSAEHTWQRGE